MKTGKSTVVVHKNSEAKLKKKLIWGVNIYRNLFFLDKLCISMKKFGLLRRAFLCYLNGGWCSFLLFWQLWGNYRCFERVHITPRFPILAASYNLWEKFGIIFQRDWFFSREHLEARGITIALPHFYMPPKIFNRLSLKFNGSQTQRVKPLALRWCIIVGWCIIRGQRKVTVKTLWHMESSKEQEVYTKKPYIGLQPTS